MRLSNHHLMIERGRHIGLKLEQRICNKYTLNEIEDEKHAMMKCLAYKGERKKLLACISNEVENWDTIDMEQQFVNMMQLNIQPLKIAKCINHIVNWEQNTNDIT